MFGEFIGYLGGTLIQLLMPALFVAYFWRQGDRHASIVRLAGVLVYAWSCLRGWTYASSIGRAADAGGPASRS